LARTCFQSLGQFFKNKLRFQIGVLSLANQGFGFSKVSVSIKFGIFSGGSFPSFCFSKIGSWFLFQKFLFKFAQVSKIGFVVFNQVLVSK